MSDLSTELVDLIDQMKSNGWGSNDILSFVKTVLQNREDDEQAEEYEEDRTFRKELFDEWR